MVGGSTLEGTSPEQRFRALYAAHHLEIYGYLRRRTDAETARDAAAETFLVVWRRLGDVPAGDGSRPWIYGIARKALANQRHSHSRFLGLRRRLSSVAEDAEAHPGPEAVVVREAECQAVHDALDRLHPSDRELLRLVAWEELSHEEIGMTLGCSAHAIDQRLLRAKRRLEHELRRSDRPGRPADWAAMLDSEETP